MAVHTGVRGGTLDGGGQRFSSPAPLWRKVLSTTVVGVPLLLGARYVVAEAREKRRMRLVVDGMGRFGR
ncbi:putative aarF domain-containing protein kinase 5 [Plecturocebus cupreus]